MRLLAPAMVTLAIGTLAAAGATLWAGWTFGQFDEVATAGPLDPGLCTPVVGIAGAGDIEPVPGTGAAFLATFDRRGNAERGEVLRFDTDDPLDAGSWRDRTGGVPAAFVPSGLDLFETTLPDGRALRRLFVVNLAGPEVVAFDVDEAGDLAVAERFSHEGLTSPNDVVATGPRSFYVTNDTASGRTSFRGKADFLLGRRTGSVMRFDGKRWSAVADGLAFPNGLALSADGRTLHVAEMRAKRLLRYARDPGTDQIEIEAKTPLPSFPNNLSVDEGGVLVGALPQPMETSAYGEGLRDAAPSELLRVTPDGSVETMFRDPGDALPGVTMATRVGERLLVGSRAADSFLMCGPRAQGRMLAGAGT